jgi:ribosomal protein L24
VPGRIYAEVNTFAQATALAQAIPELKPSRISPVPRDELYRILNIASTRLAPHQWTRVAGRRRKWRVYGGDTGLVLMIQGSEKLYLALVPRLAIGDADPEVQRPPQALVSRLHLAHIKGEKSIKEDIEGRYIWKGYMFSKEGFLLIDLDKFELLPLVETVPRTAELDIFRTTTIIPPRIARRTEEMIRRTRMKLGDRVKVVTGEYLGLIGEITEILEDDSEVNIYMPSQDITQNMLKNDVRVTYRVGDQVKVLDGEHKGLAAWVVAILLDSLRILNLEKQIEVSTLLIQYLLYIYVGSSRRSTSQKLTSNSILPNTASV